MAEAKPEEKAKIERRRKREKLIQTLRSGEWSFGKDGIGFDDNV